MKKFLSLLLALLLVPAAALASGLDLSAMTDEELTALRDAVDRELAARSAVEQVNLDGVLIRMNRAEVGKLKAGGRALIIWLEITNTRDRDFSVFASLGVQAALDGTVLGELSLADVVTLPDGSRFTERDGRLATIAPGAVAVKIGLGYFLPKDAGTVVLDLRENFAPGSFAGSFVFTLPLQ